MLQLAAPRSATSQRATEITSLTFHDDGTYSVRLPVPMNNKNRLHQAIRSRFPEKPIDVLKNALNPKGRTLDVQTYIVDGKEFIPVFTSTENLRASTDIGGAIDNPKIAIQRGLLLSVISDQHLYRLDPHLPSELWFSGEDLKKAFTPTDDHTPSE